jgi:hypothetical protein
MCSNSTRTSWPSWSHARTESPSKTRGITNNYFRDVIGTPFGGTKHSGYGREHAIETLREFSYTKMVRFPSGLGTIPSWRAVDDIFDATTGTGTTAT